MGIREITKSGAFAVTVLALVVVLVPFGLEQIGEATGWFAFPARKTVLGWFSSPASAKKPVAAKSVDWERYRQDLGKFAQWVEGHDSLVIRLSVEPTVIRVVEEEDKSERRIWAVPVVSCTAGTRAEYGAGGAPGYMFISGFDRVFKEGAMIEPSEDKCGYEILFIGERTVWLRVVLDGEGGDTMNVVKLPEFTRVEGECLVRGNRKFVAHDAFPLPSGGWLMIDSFLPPDGVVFKVLDEHRREELSMLCIVIGEKGGRQ